MAYHAVRVDAGTYQLHCMHSPVLLADSAMSDHPEQGRASSYDELRGTFACRKYVGAMPNAIGATSRDSL